VKKIVIFTGAGISAESGVQTFRDAKTGLWNNHNIDDVATISGWRKNRELVLNFYNELRTSMPNFEPNDAHKALVELEEEYDVKIITQNVDDLHERAGSKNIIHLHGELTKARGAIYDHKSSPADNVIDIGYKEIKIGDKCPLTGSQLRPHIVWFGEYPFGVSEACEAISQCDILLIIGTSLQISYTLDVLNKVKRSTIDNNGCDIYYIDPKPMHYLDNYGLTVNYVDKKAVEGVREIVNKLKIK